MKRRKDPSPGIATEISLIIGSLILLISLPLSVRLATQKEKVGEIRKRAWVPECDGVGTCCSQTEYCSADQRCVSCPSGKICRSGSCVTPTPTPSQDECQTPDDCQAPGRCNVSCYGSPRRCHWTPCPTSSPTPTSFPSCTSCTNPSAPVGAVRCNANGNVSECVRRYNQCYWQQVTDCQGRGCTNGQCNSSSSTPTPSQDECQTPDDCQAPGRCNVSCYGSPRRCHWTPCPTSSPTPLPSFQGCTNPLGNLGETRCSENNILSTCVARYGVYFWSGQVCPYGCEVINNVAQCRSSLPTSLPSPSPSSFTSPPSCRQQGQSCTGSGQGNCCSGLVCVSVRGYPVCQPGCIPGEKRCSSDGKFLEECQNNQWVPIKRCDNGCDSTKKECNPVCIPNTTKCFDANTLQTCASDGSGWTKEYCSYGCQETAKGAFCISPTPTPAAITGAPKVEYTPSFQGINDSCDPAKDKRRCFDFGSIAYRQECRSATLKEGVWGIGGGYKWTSIFPCPTNECNSQGTDCELICQPNSSACQDGKIWNTCNPDGLGVSQFYCSGGCDNERCYGEKRSLSIPYTGDYQSNELLPVQTMPVGSSEFYSCGGNFAPCLNELDCCLGYTCDPSAGICLPDRKQIEEVQRWETTPAYEAIPLVGGVLSSEIRDINLLRSSEKTLGEKSLIFADILTMGLLSSAAQASVDWRTALMAEEYYGLPWYSSFPQTANFGFQATTLADVITYPIYSGLEKVSVLEESFGVLEYNLGSTYFTPPGVMKELAEELRGLWGELWDEFLWEIRSLRRSLIYRIRSIQKRRMERAIEDYMEAEGIKVLVDKTPLPGPSYEVNLLTKEITIHPVPGEENIDPSRWTFFLDSYNWLPPLSDMEYGPPPPALLPEDYFAREAKRYAQAQRFCREVLRCPPPNFLEELRRKMVEFDTEIREKMR